MLCCLVSQLSTLSEVEPIVTSSGEGMEVVTLKTLPKVGLDDGPILKITQVFLNL